MDSSDFNEIPLAAIGFKARDLLCRQLDKVKVLPSSEGLPRDYRGLAEICQVCFKDTKSPTNSIIAQWIRTENNPTFQDLLDYLVRLDRYDISDDVQPILDVDALNYRLKLRQIAINNPQNHQPSSENSDIVTYDDADLVKIGLPPSQRYDAYLLYADQDEDIAKDIVNKLENDYNLKLCVKDRDIIPGAGFEHEAITYLISERCNWLIVVITPNFIDCSAQKFIYNYSVALGLSERKNKIIPCIFRVCNDPTVKQKLYKITYSTFPVDFTRKNVFKSHWEKLSEAVAAPRLPGASCIPAVESSPCVSDIESTFTSSKQVVLNFDRVDSEDAKILDKSAVPQRPPRSKNNSTSVSKIQNFDEANSNFNKNSSEISKESCSSGNSTSHLIATRSSKQQNSSIANLMTGFKNTKIAKTCRNMMKKKKKSKKLSEAVVAS